jgi:hypothetical protein
MTKPTKPSVSTSENVEAFLTSLNHPLKQEIMVLRQIILRADPQITEEIKWNAPSFRTNESFATFQLRPKEGVQIILHLGAKVRETATTGITVADPAGLLKWLAKDRAAVTFRTMAEIENLIRAWIVHV